MLTCVQEQFKGSSEDIEQQVKQHEARILNKLSNEKAWLKKKVVLFLFLVFKKTCVACVSFTLIQNR